MTIQITWLGHSCWLIESNEYRLLIDPFLDQNPSAKCKAADINATHILVSHGHFDHVADAAAIANRCNAEIISNYEIATWFQEKHQVKRAIGMNLGGAAKLPFGVVKQTIAWHSSVLPDGTYGGNPSGFLVKLSSDLNIYYAGDTALFSDMGMLAREKVDVAILPIGDLFTMGPDDSAEATALIQPRYVLPTHFNTWPPIQQDPAAWSDLIRNRTTAVPLTPQVGEAFTLSR
jgi:L-ascorbate metabolism protein UlaG (beta-lactamase superfamily)